MQARRAGRRSRRARRVPASAGSASRAELGKGEKWSLGKYALLGSEQRTHFNFSVLMVCGFIYIIYYVCILSVPIPQHSPYLILGVRRMCSPARLWRKHK